MAFGTRTTSLFLTLTADFEFFLVGSDAIALELNPRETVNIQFNVDAVGTTDDIEIQILQGQRMVTALALDGAASATSLALNTSSDAIATDDDLNSTWIIMTSGDEEGEGRLVTNSAASGDVVTLDHALSGTPSATETYDRYMAQPFNFTIDMSAAVSATNPHSKAISLDSVDGRYVLIAAKRVGSTDAHRIKLSYQVDGVSV